MSQTLTLPATPARAGALIALAGNGPVAALIR